MSCISRTAPITEPACAYPYLLALPLPLFLHL